MTDPTIEQCIAHHERCAGHERHMEQNTNLGRVQSAYHAENVEYEKATIAYLRDHAWLKAERDDERVVRVPHYWLKNIILCLPGIPVSELDSYFGGGVTKVAAWDEERKK